MAEAVVGATIQVLIENLLTMSQEQISLVRHFKNDLKKLQKTFSMVNDFLHDAEEKQVNGTVVKRWLKELEALAFEAGNVFDEINYHLLSKKVRPTENKTMKKKVQSFFSCSNNYPIAYRLKLGRRIKDINEKLKSINQQATEFGLQNRITSAQASGSSDASGSTETDSFSVDPIILGRENDVSTIVKMLITEPNPGEQVLSVLPIVGMGGLGKTTLAREVFGDEQIISHFGDNRVWVHVSRNFDVVVLLKNILTSMTAENVEHRNREALLKKLQNCLGNKKYLLVLDDIWNEDREKWDDFVKSLSGISSSTGNCMIVTTRSETVASIVKTLRIHKLESLSEDDCWLIIKAKSFDRSGDNIPSEFETMGRNIAEKCQGLPLAAKVVGGFLFGKSRDEWMTIEKNWFSDFGDVNPISKILKLSFDNLAPPSLKKCFAYCSIFPKGYEIKKKQLVELWMAEGFLQTNHQRSNINMETTGYKFLNLLLQNSLLQVERGERTVNMHDLVHDLACSVLGENDNVTDFVSQTRYIGYKSNGNELFHIPKGQERFVRTLFFSGKISDIRFSNFESLHALTLSGYDTDDLPTSIRHLKHLRYLDVSETMIKYLPDSVGELYHLQTLRAEVNKMERLPNSLSNLISLRHLHVFSSTTLPPEIGRLTSLRTLPHFFVRNEKGFEISELGNLKDLKGKLEIYNLEKVRDKNEAMGADLLWKSGICDLKLVWNGSREGEEVNDESVLEGLQPHPNLKSLSIYRFRGKSLSLWTTKMAVQLDGRCWQGLDNLMDITLDDCNQVEELPMLGHLPHLKSLNFEDFGNVRSIGSSFYNIKNCNKSRTSNNGARERDKVVVVVFRALKSLTLCRMPNLTEWAEVDFPSSNEGGQTQLYEVSVFPCLKYLTVYSCKKLVRAPIHFSFLKRLELDDMESSLPLQNICGMKLTSLKRLTVWRIEGLECLPDGLFCNSQNLTQLEIWSCQNMTSLVPCLRGGGASLTMLEIKNCPKLRELPYDLHNLNALEILCINKCPSLKSIPFPPSSRGQQHHQGFTSLSNLDITDCKGITSLPIQMIESCAPSLEELRLEGLTNFPMVIGCVHKMPRLVKLIIRDIPKFSIKDIGSIRTNNSLKRFQMDPSLSSSWDNVSFNEVVDAMLVHFVSLRSLTLTGMEHWVCLPDQLQHLTSLTSLWLSGFGIEALPEWLGNLSSLESLNADDCKSLRHLPSKQAMLRLSELTSVWIYDCPLILKEERSDNNNNNNSKQKIDGPQMVDSEYSKISHIHSIKTHGGFWQYDQ